MLTGLILGALLQFSATMEHEIDDLGRSAVATHRTPGLAIGIVEDGRIVYAHGFGVADRSSRRRFDPQTQAPVGAISMQFTSAALLLLEQDGTLKLDDPVVKYVPELTVAKNVTIRQLLEHTSGLPDPTMGADRTHSVKLDDLIAAANKLAPAAPPGTQYRANPFDYMIAGSIVARVSGVPLSDYLQQHVFIPLVMDETLLAGDTGISTNHAVGYTGEPGRFVPAHPWDAAWLYGSAGVITDVYDMAKWDIGLPLLLRVDAEREMFTPSRASGPVHAGLGWIVDARNGEPYYWQNGEIAGFHAMNALVPQQHVAVIVLANADSLHAGGTVMPEALAAQILDVVLPPARAEVDNAIVARAREWLERIADKNVDRTQLTPAFSSYLSDDAIAKANFAELGKPLAFVPVSSTAMNNGGTLYEFLVRFPHALYRYRFGVTKDGKIDEILLER